MRVIINAWDKSIRPKEMKKARTRMQQPWPPLQREDWFTPRLPSNPGMPQREGNRGEGYQGERLREEGHRGDCRHLLIDIHIWGLSGCLSFSQSWHCRARFWRRHKRLPVQPTDRMSLWSWWAWAKIRGLWPWGRRRRLWLWGIVAHLLALLR